MARGTQFQDIVKMVELEAGMSASTSANTQIQDHLKHIVNKNYAWLYNNYTWPFSVVTTDEALSAGSRYYTINADLDFEGVTEVWSKYGSEWVPVEYGIDPFEQYNLYNSDDDERSDPVLRWQAYDLTQYEVWPIPASSGTLRMRGRKKLAKLVNDSDTAVLDDYLLALFSAAELLQRQRSDDAQAKFQQANSYLTDLRANNASSKQAPFVVGGGRRRAVLRPGLDYVNRS